MGGLGHSSALGAFPQGHQPHTHAQHIGPSWNNSDTYYEGRGPRGQPGGSSHSHQTGPTSAPGSTTSGSDILESNNQDTKLDKSNILLLGPTGSGM